MVTIARTGGMHPCASEEGRCCGNVTYAAAAVRFTAHFRAIQARVMLAYDVYPFCGDGIDLIVSHNFFAPTRHATGPFSFNSGQPFSLTFAASTF